MPEHNSLSVIKHHEDVYPSNNGYMRKGDSLAWLIHIMLCAYSRIDGLIQIAPLSYSKISSDLSTAGLHCTEYKIKASVKWLARIRAIEIVETASIYGDAGMPTWAGRNYTGKYAVITAMFRESGN